MIVLRKRFYLGIALSIFSLPLLAQEEQSIPANEVKIMESKDIPLDTTALPLLEAKPINLIQASDVIKDNSLAAVTKDNTAKYDLKDLEHAAKYDSLWMKELLETNALFEDMYEEVATLDPDITYETEINTDSLKARLERLNQRTPFNIAYNPSLENVIKSFLNRKRGLMERMLTVSQFYFPLFEEQLDNYDIPLEMKYLSIVESALNPRARSRVGATGLWQFMYGTGKMYDLDVSSYVDERSDPIKATEAACKYLGKLHGIFDDWDLALAAYNSGPGNVNKAIRRSGGQKNYWNIRRNLPRETAGYVPAFIATMYLFEYAEEYGLKAKEADRTYFVTDTVHVKSLITFKQISELVGVDMEEIKLLNPSYKLDVIPFIKGKDYSLRLPVAALGKFVANEEAIYAHVKEELKSKESPLPQLVKAQDQIRYKVRSGDFLGKIASRYGVGVSQIKRWNGLRSNNLRVGQRLTIFTKNRGVVSSKKPKKKSATIANTKNIKTHTVKSGDSLWTISKKYPGISIENLREWNGISGNNLKLGTKLKLCDCSS
ncbi:LysM peptidoglycan-binding domain-containing protein [Maribacter sp.]|uniref:LysM peptidoglycan-binding domain-containing protein n=1 Tax=Maribacter sp. TaxID=1897614 RepID=UPI0025C4F111|nr:LysM peptidoglycan-binding domain-containing protein [Maribacter sp.]